MTSKERGGIRKAHQRARISKLPVIYGYPSTPFPGFNIGYNTWANGLDHRKSTHDEAVNKENRTVEKVGSRAGVRRKVATIGDKSRPGQKRLPQTSKNLANIC